MKYSLALVSAFAAVSLAGPLEMRQNAKLQALKAKEDELCKSPNKFNMPEDQCRQQVKQCVVEQGPRAKNFDGVVECMERKHGNSSNSAPAPTKKLLPFLKPGEAGGNAAFCGVRDFEENDCGTKYFCEGLDNGTWRAQSYEENPPYKSTADCFAAHEKDPNRA